MILKACGLFSLVASCIWAASPAARDWIGTLKPGGAELRLLLHVKEADGKLSATIDSIDHGANGIPIDKVTFADNKLTFESSAVSGQYEGKYDATKRTFSGTWSQNGNDLPLSFEPYVEKPKAARTGPAAKPSDIDGTWEGKIDAGGQSLWIVFHIKTDEDGNLTATTDSPEWSQPPPTRRSGSEQIWNPWDHREAGRQESQDGDQGHWRRIRGHHQRSQE